MSLADRIYVSSLSNFNYPYRRVILIMEADVTARYNLSRHSYYVNEKLSEESYWEDKISNFYINPYPFICFKNP